MNLIETLDQRDVGSRHDDEVVQMDLIETLEKLTGVVKELLDICEEQAKVIEMHDLVSADDALSRRGELESFRDILNKAIGG